MTHKRSNAQIVNIFRFIQPVHGHLKTDKVDLKENTVKKNILHTFAIPSSSRHEKCCRMLEIIFCLFQCSKNIEGEGSLGQTNRNASNRVSWNLATNLLEILWEFYKGYPKQHVSFNFWIHQDTEVKILCIFIKTELTNVWKFYVPWVQKQNKNWLMVSFQENA